MTRNVSILIRRSLSLLALAAAVGSVPTPAQSQSAQPASPPAPTAPPASDPPTRDWHAGWITHPTAPLREPIVLHFRRAVTLASVPTTYPVRVSADNRFILYVNGHRVGDGPARGDLLHWRYERFDLAPFLKAGDNLITATVWNFGIYAPIAQMTDRTAFLLESEAAGAASISTPEGWLVEKEDGQRAFPRVANGFWQYFASGPGEEMDAARYDWSWNSPAASGPAWVPATTAIPESIYPQTNKAHSTEESGDNPWGLIPDGLPAMEYKETQVGRCLRSEGATHPSELLASFLAFPGASVTIPAQSHIHLMLDRSTLTTAYPRLTLSGGKGARIKLTYAEALYDDKQQKGDRDSLYYTDSNNVNRNRVALGISDSFLPDGGAHRVFEPLWWRTWRYLDIEIESAAEPLTLESLTANFTAYPFEQKASFHSPDPDLDKIWEISWRTARLDAHETYMDTPYYEQLQYVGDTRIQMLISYAVAGDDRLARQAIRAFDDSRIPEGLTASRYPSSLYQSIPTFSLIYIGMLHDYWMYRPDADGLVTSKLNGVRAILDWYAQYREPGGLLHRTPGWSFVDWVSGKGEIPTYDADGVSCVTSLHYLGALDQAADLENAIGDKMLGQRDRDKARNLRTEIARRCWSAERGLVADNPALKNFSQQANILAVLYDVVPPRPAARRPQAHARHRARHHPRRRSLRLLLFPLLPGPRARPCRPRRPISRLDRSMAEAAPAPLLHLARDPRRNPLRLPRMERPPHLRPAHPRRRHRTRKPRLRHRAHCPSPRRSTHAYRPVPPPAGSHFGRLPPQRLGS